MERLRVAADRALALGQDLVDWCRAPLQGGRHAEGGWVELVPLLEELLVEQQPLAQRKGLRLEADLAVARGLDANTDAGRLTRLVSNLLSNAVRYTDRGHVRLAADWRAGQPGERWLVLSVEDTGAGLAADEQDAIFLAFHRGRSGRGDSDSSGSGLGLSVVDRLVHDLGMTLEVHSESDRGSRFDLLIPAELVRERP
jgi:signal transduction histidine kinase